MSRIVLFPYKIGSQSCKDIQNALQNNFEGKVIRVHRDRRYIRRRHDVVINWGNSGVPRWDYANIINPPQAVHLAVNKLRTLVRLKEEGVTTVPFTTDMGEAMRWGSRVFARTVLEGHSGEGVVITEAGEPVPQAPLYTRYIPRSREYRVHVFNGVVIDYAKKIKRVEGGIISNAQEGDMVRSNELGWEYLRDVEPRPSVAELAVAAVRALGLHFGAVDIIRDREGNNYVLEVGTAAGLSPIGVEAYAAAIINIANGQ